MHLRCLKVRLLRIMSGRSFFDAEAAKGRGGVLSGLLAGIVGSVFPSFGGIASTIADSLPV